MMLLLVNFILLLPSDLSVNGQVFSHEHTKMTWFGALSLIVPGCEVVADFKGNTFMPELYVTFKLD